MLGERIDNAIQLMETVNQVKNAEAANKYTKQTNNTFFDNTFETFSNCLESYFFIKKAFHHFILMKSLEKTYPTSSSLSKKYLMKRKCLELIISQKA